MNPDLPEDVAYPHSSPELGRSFLLTRTVTVPQHRYWLHLLLLVLTLLTTSIVGAGLMQNFLDGRPVEFEGLDGYIKAWQDPSYLVSGLPFSLTLVAVLLAHEFGHYWAARYYQVNVTLPFFLPAPTLIGTLGAFIRVRSVILSKRILFDIGIAGPLAGFLALLLPLIAGVSLSKQVPGVVSKGELIFGTPLVLQLMQSIAFPGIPSGDIYLHPVARAAWVGLLATALNLLPIGQLDGGHILYALFGERTKYLSWFLVAALVPMGFFFAWSWIFWAALLFFFGMRHPSIVDSAPLGRGRVWLSVVALIILVLCFTPSPIRPGIE